MSQRRINTPRDLLTAGIALCAVGVGILILHFICPKCGEIFTDLPPA